MGTNQVPHHWCCLRCGGLFNDFLVLKNMRWITRSCSIRDLFISGFIVGVVLNYIHSTYWVFRGKQDSKVTKSVLFIVLFIVFSAIAYGLSYGTYELSRFIISKAANININDANINYILQFKFWGDALFWLFALAFVLKTLVGLIWNYFTRKYILYKRRDKEKEEE